MGKRIESWTDVDYAQAAIDMLPGTVEEIEEFLRAQGVKSKWVNNECPLTRWMEKWTERGASAGWYSAHVTQPEIDLPLPYAAQDYIVWVDSL